MGGFSSNLVGSCTTTLCSSNWPKSPFVPKPNGKNSHNFAQDCLHFSTKYYPELNHLAKSAVWPKFKMAAAAILDFIKIDHCAISIRRGYADCNQMWCDVSNGHPKVEWYPMPHFLSKIRWRLSPFGILVSVIKLVIPSLVYAGKLQQLWQLNTLIHKHRKLQHHI